MARILIIDDEENSVRILSLALSVLGHEGIGAGSIDEAIPIIEQNSPDMILVDYMMPDANGIEATERIRASVNGKSIPIFMATAGQDSYLAEKMLQVGGTGYLTKPVGMEILEELISEYVMKESSPIPA
jgi:CheY-like chemotaxis protein